MPPRRAAVLLGSLLFMVPLFAHAEQTTVWDFRNGKVPGEWNVKNLTSAQPIAEGVHVQTQIDGILWRTLALPHPLDVVTITLQSNRPIEASLLWHERGDSNTRLRQFKFAIEESGKPVTIDIVPGTTRGWDRYADQIGMEFPQGADVTVSEMKLRGWGTGERFVEGIKSFWTFDSFRPYSINFLWGPLFSFSGPARTQLFLRLPPYAISAVRLFYAILIIIGLGGWLTTFFSRRSPTVLHRSLAAFAVTMIALWLLFDVRMGLEILNYARTDINTHVRKPLGEKTLRTHDNFYDIVARAMPILQGVSRYALLTTHDAPFYQNLRYMTYPVLPVLPGENVDTRDIGLLFVLERPDIHVRDHKVYGSDGVLIVGNGKIIADYGNGSFLYGTER